MKPYLGIEKTIKIGSPLVTRSDAVGRPWSVEFEDNGETGYFYARDHREDIAFVDALHIYQVDGHPANQDISCHLKILWTRDFSAAAILIDLRPKAVFDFEKKIGYARDPFPEQLPHMGWEHSELDSEELKRRFFS